VKEGGYRKFEGKKDGGGGGKYHPPGGKNEGVRVKKSSACPGKVKGERVTTSGKGGGDGTKEVGENL